MFASFFQGVFCSGSRKEEDLNPKPRVKYLVLDLDETLISCKEEMFDSHDFVIDFERHKQKYYLSKRPHVTEFIEKMAQHYTIVIYTASSKLYAFNVLRKLQIIQHVKRLFHRRHLVDCFGGHLTKDLSLLGVPLKDVVLVDDCYENSYLYPSNFLQIGPYRGDRQDRELLDLIPFLVELSKKDDVRCVHQHYGEFKRRIPEKFSKYPQLVKQISAKSEESTATEGMTDGISE